jgi:phosphoribosyl-AMP cyclohydrolase
VELDYSKLGGLVPAIVQDFESGEVLMLGFMNAEALEATLETGDVTFYSRSRKTLWTKGEQSGHRLRLREMRVDCDADAVLVSVEATGPGVCHEGYRNCFFRRLSADGTLVIASEKTFDAGAVYGKGEPS